MSELEVLALQVAWCATCTLAAAVVVLAWYGTCTLVAMMVMFA